MFPNGPNPSKLQPAPPGSPAKTPLVLFHDGGGTVFGYFFLGSLGREVWALHDPHYWDSEPWDGGIDERAETYIDLMRRSGIRGQVLLGGWSLGGLLSVKIAHLLAQEVDADIRVKGLLLIDSPRQRPASELPPTQDPDFGDMPDLVRKSFQECDRNLATWELPLWHGPALNGQPAQIRAGGQSFELAVGKILRQGPGAGELLAVEGADIFTDYKETAAAEEKKLLPPPGVFIRATKPVPKTRTDAPICAVDVCREQKLLGWDGTYPEFLKASLDVDSDHFSLFDKADRTKLASLTGKVLQGLEILDSMDQTKK